MTAGEETKAAPYTPGANAVDITPEKNGGVLKEIIKEGEGEAFPGNGCTVTTHYHGTLLDGTVFDSSKASGKPFEFTLGKGSVIKAWDLGVATMKKGEVAMLTCKPEYAYGARGSPPKIPENATLVFEITLLGWQAEDVSKAKDGGILRTNITKGEGYLTPNDGALVKIHITGTFDGRVFEDRDVDFELGEGSEKGIIEGVEKALEKFKKGEKSSLEIKPKYAFKDKGHEKFGIPPYATVHYTVELKDFERAKESWDMDTADKINQAKLLKEKATNYFKAGKYPLALRFYTKIIDYIDSDAGFNETENEERKALMLANRLNLGLVHLKMKQPYDAKNECDKALELDPNSVKGLFRRGEALLEMGEPETAKQDFEAVVKLEPNNKLAANKILICAKQIKEQRQKEKQIYANMFEKFANKDKEKEAMKREKEPDTMKVLGEWGKDERDREPTEFEQENPDILMLNTNDEFKNM